MLSSSKSWGKSMNEDFLIYFKKGETFLSKKFKPIYNSWEWLMLRCANDCQNGSVQMAVFGCRHETCTQTKKINCFIHFKSWFFFRSDRRGFKCVAYNVSDSSSDSESCSEGVAFVRVKDKYAALWPFLGIVAEVVVLLTVILVRKQKSILPPFNHQKSKQTFLNTVYGRADHWQWSAAHFQEGR